MKQLFYISLLLLLLSSTSFAQVEITRQVIGSAGGFETGNNITISYTVGESVTQTVTNNFILTQGFQQVFSEGESKDSLKPYSGITPNGDGINDTWIIDNIENYTENKVQLFNRWGNEVWARENYDNNSILWDGKNNKGEDLGNGTYFYIILVEGKSYKGWIEITR